MAHLRDESGEAMDSQPPSYEIATSKLVRDTVGVTGMKFLIDI
jgi:hypothetical protein